VLPGLASVGHQHRGVVPVGPVEPLLWNIVERLLHIEPGIDSRLAHGPLGCLIGSKGLPFLDSEGGQHPHHDLVLRVGRLDARDGCLGAYRGATLPSQHIRHVPDEQTLVRNAGRVVFPRRKLSMRPSQARARIDIAPPGPPRAYSNIGRSHGAGAEPVQGLLAGFNVWRSLFTGALSVSAAST
jgi:hypothetical protein